ncbi:hypothetical protein Tco_0013410 [Tanacetum coccineum]
MSMSVQESQVHKMEKITFPQNAAFQTNDIDAYDFDCDEISSAKVVLMANLSSYDSDVLSEVREGIGVATPRALVYAGLMTSGDARSRYMISGNAKS